MKTIYSIGLAALVTLASQSLDVARIVHAENQTWTGTISSSNCGGNHTPGLSAPNARSSASNTEQHTCSSRTAGRTRSPIRQTGS